MGADGPGFAAQIVFTCRTFSESSGFGARLRRSKAATTPWLGELDEPGDDCRAASKLQCIHCSLRFAFNIPVRRLPQEFVTSRLD
jgi:hypothetical protein